MPEDRGQEDACSGRENALGQEQREATRDAFLPMAESAPRRETGFWTIFPGVMLSMFLAAIDQTILATALPAIAGSLRGVGLAPWIIVAYLLASTVAAPIYGRLGDVFGRRRMLLVALGVFMTSSVVCALAESMLQLVLARAAQGLGGGGLMTLSQALIGEVVPPRQRGRYQGYLGAVFASASAAGPIAGGFLVEHVSWEAVFLVNIPLGLCAAAFALRLPAPVPGPAPRFSFDWVGTALFASGTTGLLLALSSFGSGARVELPLASILLVGATLALVGFVHWERRTSSPLIPPQVLGRPAVWRSDLTVVCTAAALISTVTYLPLYLQVARGFGAGRSGLILTPLTLCLIFSGTLTGRLMSRTGRTTAYPSFGIPLALAAATGLALTTSAGSTWMVLLLVALFGIGLGTVMPVMQIVVQVSATRETLGSATASVSFARSIGGALGVASIGAILFATLSLIDPAAGTLFAQLVERGPDFMASLDENERVLLDRHLATAFAIAFGSIAVFTALAFAMLRTIPRTQI